MFARRSDGTGVRWLAVLAATLGLAAACPPGASAARGGSVGLTVDSSHPGREIPAQFLGLGFEYKTLARYSGAGTTPLNPVLVQLIANISPGQGPVLRIGGDTTDWSWWPIPGMQPPAPISDAITPQWLSAYRNIQRKLGARLILGINLQTDSKPVARTEAHALLGALGSASVAALELGNEPELYTSFGYSRAPDGSYLATQVPGWDFAQFERGFSGIASALPAVPLAGPTMGNQGWDSEFGQFLSHEPRVRIATAHRYPLDICSKPDSPRFPSALNVLSDPVSAGLAQRLSPLVRAAQGHHVPLRIDEMNLTPCPERAGELRGSFAPALWSTAALFDLASVGVAGVNIQSSTGGTDDLFSFEHTSTGWRADVAPEYYGLLLFAQAAPVRSRLVRLINAPRAPLHAWATLTPDGVLRVVAVNAGAGPQRLAVRVPGAVGPGTLERMLGRLHSGRGVSLAGQTFGASTGSGVLAGRSHQTQIQPAGQQYAVPMPGYSAALFTVNLH